MAKRQQRVQHPVFTSPDIRMKSVVDQSPQQKQSNNSPKSKPDFECFVPVADASRSKMLKLAVERQAGTYEYTDNESPICSFESQDIFEPELVCLSDLLTAMECNTDPIFRDSAYMLLRTWGAMPWERRFLWCQNSMLFQTASYILGEATSGFSHRNRQFYKDCRHQLWRFDHPRIVNISHRLMQLLAAKIRAFLLPDNVAVIMNVSADRIALILKDRLSVLVRNGRTSFF